MLASTIAPAPQYPPPVHPPNLQLARFGQLVTATDPGSLIPTRMAGATASTSTTYGSQATDVIAVVGPRQLFSVPLPFAMKNIQFQLLVLANIEVVVASAGAPFIALNVSLELVQPGVATPVQLLGTAAAPFIQTNTFDGSGIATTVTPHTALSRILARDYPTDAELRLGLQLSVIIASGAGGSTGEYRINHDAGAGAVDDSVLSLVSM